MDRRSVTTGVCWPEVAAMSASEPALLRLDIASLIAASFRTSSVAWVAAETDIGV